jgi:putative hydrolase of the HAD superfamily
MQFDNYIFDLYGTLIDIHTDEEKKSLWQAMCRYLEKEFQVKYTPAALKKRYLQICKEEEELLKSRLSSSSRSGDPKPTHCEIRISWVWERLISEASQITSDKFDADSKAIKYGPKEQISPKMQALCTFFREKSRDKLIKYDGVDEVLKTLKEMGKGVFLLSNAQHAFTMKELSDCALTEYFDDIFISSDLLVKKPEPLFMKALLKKHSLDLTKCVMIGNEISSDVGVAAGSGLKSIFLNTYSYSDKKVGEDLEALGITQKELLPVIVRDGDIRKILRI